MSIKQMTNTEEKQENEEIIEEREAIEVTITDIELEALRSEVSEHKDKYFRLLAEQENSRKRMQKDQRDSYQYAMQSVILEFLNPIDHMEGALKHTGKMSDEVKNWALGFEMILTQFKDVLTTHGVKSFESKGKSFDPHLHEAVEMVETDEIEPGIVVEESLKGYVMGERTIRPARVTVSKKIEEKNSEENQEKS